MAEVEGSKTRALSRQKLQLWLANRIAGVPETTMTSTFRRTRSLASSGGRSSSPPAQRYSKRMFLP